MQDIELRPPTWYAEKGIELLTGAACTALRSAAREVMLSTGTSIAYDRLVLATGSLADAPADSRAAILPGVLTFRDLEDVAAMQRAQPGTPVGRHRRRTAGHRGGLRPGPARRAR